MEYMLKRHNEEYVAGGYDGDGLFNCHRWYGDNQEGDNPIPGIQLTIVSGGEVVIRFSEKETQRILSDMWAAFQRYEEEDRLRALMGD